MRQAATDAIRGIGEAIKSFLESRFGSGLKAVILYGSYARATAVEESDVDFLVVVDEALSPWEVHRSLDDLLFRLLLETGRLVSVIVVPERHYERYRSPFLANVRREGIRI